MTSVGSWALASMGVAGLVGCFGSSSSASPPGGQDASSTPVAADSGGDAMTAEAGATGASDSSTIVDAGGDGATSTTGGDSGCAGDGGPGTFTCTGSLATPRIAPGAAVLSTGSVLVAGGWNATSQTVTSAEVYDPTTGSFAATGGMTDAHLWAGWTAPWPVLSSGKVLVGGGLAASGALLASVELYDPSAGTFSLTGPLGTPVLAFDLVSLGGSVLFIGGYSAVTGAPPTPGWEYTAGTSLVQSYSVTAATVSPVGPVAEARLFGCNVVLQSGDAVAIGGTVGTAATFESNIEQYDPTTMQWTTVGTLANDVTCSEGAFLLPNGQILLDGAALLDPTTWATTPLSNPLPNTSVMLVQLANGDVLGVGGQANGMATVQTERFNASTGQWAAVGSLHQPRSTGRALLLPSGDVLVVGGSDATGAALATAELFHP